MNKRLYAELEVLSRRSRKRGKPKSARSQFYSKLMTGLAGDRGEAIAKAFVAQDRVKFTQMWKELTNQLLAQLPSPKE